MTQLGIILGIRNHPASRLPLAQTYEQYIGDAVLAEKYGFHHIWVNEHYFSEDDYCPAALPIMAKIAARTERVRIGSAVFSLPFHDPLRLALDVAVLDVLADGRVDLGLGIGSRHEQELAGLSQREAWRRGWEAADFIERALTMREIAFRGRYYDYDRCVNLPEPIQRPLPIWWGGFGPQSMQRAALRGYDVIGSASAAFDQALVAAGRAPSDHNVAQIMYLHIADTRDRAWDEAQGGLHWMMTYHRERGDIRAGATPRGELAELPPAAGLREIEGLGFRPTLPFIVGTVDEVAADLLPFCRGEHGRITELALTFRHPGMETAHVRRSMQLFVDRVVPALVSEGAEFDAPWPA